ncbi:hypothetical protein CPB86DRAFT_753697 [Serendipita vermifera]|nr:hypothetical protein CPB86DRAFT_753697 [Serendipita vermifera]
MRWAGSFVRLQQQHRTLTIYWCQPVCRKAPSATKDVSTLLRCRSTNRSYNLKSSNDALLKDEKQEYNSLESFGDQIVRQWVSPSSSHSAVNPLEEEVESEEEPVEKPTTSSTQPFERLKAHRPPIKPIPWGKEKLMQAESQELEEDQLERDNLLSILAQSNSPTHIWQAYLEAVRRSLHVPPELLDRITRVVIRNHAPTRKTFLQLHQVLNHLRQEGQPIKRWQWNSLIYHSALGLRKVWTKDYQAALDVYREMLSMQAKSGNAEHCRPDLYTYTTLLYIAIRTGVQQNVEHAYSLLKSSNLRLDRVSRLAIIPYYIHNKHLVAIRRLAREFMQEKEDIGIDGINAYLWAHGKYGKLEAVEDIYRALRANIPPGDIVDLKSRSSISDSEDHPIRPNQLPAPIDVDAIEDFYERESQLDWALLDLAEDFEPSDDNPPNIPSPHQVKPDSNTRKPPGPPNKSGKRQNATGDLVIWAHHVPNQITYTLCMQTFAYHGRLSKAFEIFRDMLTTLNREQSWRAKSIPYKALHQAYRALFLGFVRSARNLVEEPEVDEEEDENWKRNALEFVFESFLDMDRDQLRPNDRLVSWIMHSYEAITHHDEKRLVEVWRVLEARFGRLRVPRNFRYIAKLARDPTDDM